MSSQTHRFDAVIVHVEIHEKDGLFVATSPQYAELNLAHGNMQELFADIPNILRAIIRDRTGEDVFVFRAKDPTAMPGVPAPWVAIPPHIAAAMANDHSRVH